MDDEEEEEAPPPTPEDIIRTNVLVRVSKIADTVLKLLLAPAIRNIQDEDREGSSSSSKKAKAVSKNQPPQSNADPTTTETASVAIGGQAEEDACLLYTSPSPRDS
eukprot:TRINITY_DN59061_c0_g1_i1.p1 TRINITY_DN59061_c0_g1~~TRINITY_DN59061_c0_g1_i1.p1  ORF type:complete len:106 (+),score=39.72 TRINITY_DN59061_c0_g1_i1:1-318(+)